MTTSEPDSFADLIADCADIPDALQATEPPVPGQRAATPWEVDDTCYAVVGELEEYV